jgi:hypothetical protein
MEDGTKPDRPDDVAAAPSAACGRAGGGAVLSAFNPRVVTVAVCPAGTGTGYIAFHVVHA